MLTGTKCLSYYLDNDKISDGDCLSSDMFGDAFIMSLPLSTLELVRGESPLLGLLRVVPGMEEVAVKPMGDADAPSGCTS